jgi:di/tricarboxylate transporter
LVFNLDMLLVLAVLLLAMVLFVTEWVAVDVASLLILVVLGLMGLVPPNQLFSGFASNSVMAILAVMILGAGLDRTGVLAHAATLILKIAGDTERRLILALSAVAGATSGFMQNPAVTALFLPVASQISARTGYPLSRLLLPMAACIVTGGTMTMVGNSPMILLNDLIESTNRNLAQGEQTLATLPIFFVFPVGLALLLASLLYFYFVGIKRLPNLEYAGAAVPRTTEAYFERLYETRGEVIELRVYGDSMVVGKTIGEIEALPGAPIFLAMKSGIDSRLAPPADELIQAGVVLAVIGTPEGIEQFAAEHGLGVLPGKHHLGALFDPLAAGVSEAVLPPNSSFISHSAFAVRLRKRYGMNLLAIQRAGATIRENVRNLPMQSGDTLIFHSSWEDLSDHIAERDFVVITDYPKDERRPRKQGVALIFFVGAFLLALMGHIPLPVALMAGAVGMLATRVLTMEEAYRAINWKTIFSLACLIPLSIAIEQTGTAAWIASALSGNVGAMPVVLLQLLLAIVTTLIASIMSQVGATVLMVPLAINMALAVGANPAQFAVIAALAASNNFFTANNPVIGMIIGPGSYKKADLIKVGLPLSAIYVVVSVLMVRLWF